MKTTQSLPSLLLPLLLLAAKAAAAASGAEPPQIHWLQTLDQAQAVASATGRPLLLAVNMDGESASERIVREKYRDPEFVALTRRAVCLVSSVFRHTPRDDDDQGNRIVCPRLGRVTCGEHIALEPVLYDRYLGGERIAPRHAFVTPDGEVALDLFLLFDLDQIDSALEQALAPWPAEIAWPPVPPPPGDSFKQLLTQARTRAAFDQLAETARELKLEDLADREVRADLGRVPSLPVRFPNPLERLRLLIALDPERASTRTRLLAHFTLTGDERTGELLADAFGAPLAERIRRAVQDAGLAVHAVALLELAKGVREQATLEPLIQDQDPDELRAALAQALERLRADEQDPAHQAAVGLVSLALAKWSIDAGEAGADIYLADAETFLESARERIHDSPELLLASARSAYYGGRIEEQETFAVEALSLLPRLPELPLDRPGEAAGLLAEPAVRQEAWRWLGDAAGRLLARRSGSDPLIEALGLLRGGRALLFAAASPRADEVDWQSAGSYLGAVGLPLHELAWLDEGRRRFPDSSLIANAISTAFWRSGRPELAVSQAHEIASLHPDSANCAWYLGYARVALGDWLRRQEQPDQAIAVYEQAEQSFRESLELAPEYEASVVRWLARLALSRGFAHLLSDRQAEAASCLVEGIGLDQGIAPERDGLDREAVDLLDGALEWRARGASPVDALDLVRQLLTADPDNALWPRSVADSELREALRADGRDERAAADAFLQLSIQAAEQALELGGQQQDVHVLAQDLTIFAERLLARGEPDRAREFLVRAAPLLDQEPPPPTATLEQLRAMAADLRQLLGEPRPINREGR